MKHAVKLLAILLLSAYSFAQNVDQDIQQKAFASHAGGSIGGDAPKSYTFDQFPGAIPGALVSVVGYDGEYCDVDWYTSRPVFSNTGHLSLAYDDTFDAATLTNAQALERDTKLTVNGLQSNFSFQIDVAGKWELQISGNRGQWVNTGFQIQPLAANVAHHFLLTYSFDLAAKVYSYKSIAIDGITYDIPANLQGLAMVSSTWPNGALFQFQQDTTNGGGAYNEYLNNVTYTWW